MNGFDTAFNQINGSRIGENHKDLIGKSIDFEF
jgi:hypothetical protein